MEQTFIANSIQTYITNKFKLDSNLSNVLNIVILKFIDTIKSFNYSNYKIIKKYENLFKLILNQFKFIILAYIIKIFISYKTNKKLEPIKNELNDDNSVINDNSNNENTLYNIDISNIDKYINAIHKFINLHPEFFNLEVSYSIISIPNTSNNYKVFKDKVLFNDKIHNVEGFITTKFSKKLNNDKQYEYNNVMNIHITKSNNSNQCYINQIDQYIDNQIKFGKIIDLNYYKILSRNIIVSNFYNESLDKWRDDCKYMEDSFFSQYKEFLFKLMKSKNNYEIDASNNWNNLILYGPPGVGKSSFIYRIATIMKKQIVSIDLSLYLDKKKELYSIFNGQEFKLPDGNESYTICSKNVIILLEEFDNCIKKLVDLEKIYKLKQDLIESEFEKKKNLLINNEPGFDPENNGIKSEKVSLNKISHEIEQILHTNNLNLKSDILRISDLLELFQGPVPVKDRLIIATTNYYDDIKQSLPALFRPGRLTPLEFNYLSWDCLNDLSKYYFNSNMTINEIKITLPTSQIVELAVRYKDNHNKFQEELLKLHNITIDENNMYFT